MTFLSMPQFALACQVFLKLAYPDGLDSIPSNKRVYHDLPSDKPVSDYLPATGPGHEICQPITGPEGAVRGYALRLGSAHFPNLKLKVQLVDHNHSAIWVFTVDTHDAFSRNSFHPPEDHPDAQQWLALQLSNRVLKESIEAVWQQAGLTTFNSLLRSDLKNAAP